MTPQQFILQTSPTTYTHEYAVVLKCLVSKYQEIGEVGTLKLIRKLMPSASKADINNILDKVSKIPTSDIVRITKSMQRTNIFKRRGHAAPERVTPNHRN